MIKEVWDLGYKNARERIYILTSNLKIGMHHTQRHRVKWSAGKAASVMIHVLRLPVRTRCYRNHKVWLLKFPPDAMYCTVLHCAALSEVG